MKLIYLPKEVNSIRKLTIGKEYEVKYMINRSHNSTSKILVINDIGQTCYYYKEYFKDISEIRDDKLKELGI